MSIDPASRRVDLPDTATSLGALPLGAAEIHVFDFDGVVTSSTEDDLYHLQTWREEAALLAAARRQFCIRCEGMETKYQRHLIYQASAFFLGLDIEPGPGFSALQRASQHGRLFILTARSGWYAVERLRTFLARRGIVPIEIFNVGRVTKDKQIDLLLREFPANRINYVEDNPAHLDAVHHLHSANLNLVLCPRSERQPADALRALFMQTVEEALLLEAPSVSGAR